TRGPTASSSSARHPSSSTRTTSTCNARSSSESSGCSRASPEPQRRATGEDFAMATISNLPDPTEQIRRMLKTVESGRHETMRRIGESAETEERALLRIRGKLLRDLPPDDPRIAALDRRLEGIHG